MADKLTWTDGRRKLSELIPWDQNPRLIRTKEAERLVKSLEDFGQIHPIAIDPDNEILDGHQRQACWSTAEKYGPDHEVDVRIASRKLTKKERQKLVVYLHRGTVGEWDWDELANSFEMSDLLDWGFDEKELAGNSLGIPDIVDGEDDTPEVPKEAKCKEGDLWTLGYHRLLCGDSTNAQHVERLLDGNTPFMIVTDPPYGVEYEGGEVNKQKRNKLIGDENANLYEPAFSLTRSIILYTWFADSNGLNVYSSILNNGFIPRALLIWNKLNAHYGAPSAHYKQRHEPCIYAVKKGCSAKWNGDMKVSTVWDIEQPHKNEFHPTQKPVECMARPIRNHGDKDDAVYDPFCGSGTTIIAAEKLNRQCYAMEIAPEYCDVILQRWANFTGKEPVRDDGKKWSEL